MTGARRQALVAAALVVVLAVLLVMQVVGGSTDPVGDGPTQASGSQGRAPVSPEASAVADVRLELLRPAASGSPQAGRNLFRFRPRPEPVVFRPPAPPVQVGPPVPPGPPPLPPIALRFIGLLEAPQSSGRIAILSDGRGNVFNVKEGDIIEGRYRLLQIGADSADLAYLDGRGRQTIRLSGQ